MAKTTVRKKKVKRSFTRGVAHIHATFNTASQAGAILNIKQSRLME